MKTIEARFWLVDTIGSGRGLSCFTGLAVQYYINHTINL